MVQATSFLGKRGALGAPGNSGHETPERGRGAEAGSGDGTGSPRGSFIVA